MRNDYLVDGTSQLITNKSIIEDALSAINATSGAILRLTGSTFDNNLISISIVNGSYTSSSIYDNLFRCSSSLRSPSFRNQTEKQIVLDNVSDIKIGDNNQQPNHFSTCDYDIFSTTSQSRFFNNTFMASVACISASNNNALNGRILFAGDGGTPGNNYFSSAPDGILLYGQSANIYSNNFNSHNKSGLTSVYAKLGNSLKIINNTMTNVKRGIDCIQNNLNLIAIVNNAITTSTFIQSMGIRISDFKPFTTDLLIQENYINCYGSHGILTMNNGGGRILQNNVMLRGTMYGPSKGRFCFSGLNCEKQKLDCNNLEGQSLNYANYNTNSASFSFSPNEIISCNTLANTNRGLNFLADCSSAQIFGNDLNVHRNGIVVGAVINSNTITGGVIGNQTLPDGTHTPGNKYWGTDLHGSFYDAATLSINSDLTNSDFWVNSGIYEPLTNHFTGSNATPFNPIIQPNVGPITCPEICDHSHVIDQETMDSELEQLLIGIPTFANSDELIKWLMEKGLYEKIKENPDLLDSSVVLQNFADSTQYKNEGKFADVKLALEYIFDDKSGALTPSIIQSRINDAENKNDLINPNTLYEDNEKTLNSIALASVARNRSELTSAEIQTLMEIANKCPYIAGTAVYEARSLLLLTDRELYWEDDVQCNGSTSRLSGKKNESSTFYWHVFPNPTTSKFSIAYDLSSYSFVKLQLMSVEGKVLRTEDLNTGEFIKEIDLSDYSNGIYFIKAFNSENELIKTDKISVVK